MVPLHRHCAEAEPCGDIRRKEWGEGAADAGVVGVEPGGCCRTEKRRKNCRCVDMTAGKGLELKPVTEFGRTGLAAKDDVLLADTMHALAIESRFV